MSDEQGARDAPRVVLGVGGGVAAYKACEVLRGLTESGHDVRVAPTAAALRFVGAATFEALSGHPARTDVFDDVPEVPHVRLGQRADLVVVAPATADLLARAANGLADDLLTSTLLTAHCPVLLVPAMHTEMWEHPATRHNVELLRSRGVVVAEPDSGRLTGADSGRGRLPDPVRSSISRGCCWPSPPGYPVTSKGGVSSFRPVGHVNRWTRCATWATVPAVDRGSPWLESRRIAVPM